MTIGPRAFGAAAAVGDIAEVSFTSGALEHFADCNVKHLGGACISPASLTFAMFTVLVFRADFVDICGGTSVGFGLSDFFA